MRPVGEGDASSVDGPVIDGTVCSEACWGCSSGCDGRANGGVPNDEVVETKLASVRRLRRDRLLNVFRAKLWRDDASDDFRRDFLLSEVKKTTSPEDCEGDFAWRCEAAITLARHSLMMFSGLKLPISNMMPRRDLDVTKRDALG